jgi:hypothetical protein
MTNRSRETDGLDDPNQGWLNRRLRMRKHPEWGILRVLSWFPATVEGEGQRLRVLRPGQQSPQMVAVRDVEIVHDDLDESR